MRVTYSGHPRAFSSAGNPTWHAQKLCLSCSSTPWQRGWCNNTRGRNSEGTSAAIFPWDQVRKIELTCPARASRVKSQPECIRNWLLLARSFAHRSATEAWQPPSWHQPPPVSGSSATGIQVSRNSIVEGRWLKGLRGLGGRQIRAFFGGGWCQLKVAQPALFFRISYPPASSTNTTGPNIAKPKHGADASVALLGVQRRSPASAVPDLWRNSTGNQGSCKYNCNRLTIEFFLFGREGAGSTITLVILVPGGYARGLH